MKTFEIVSGNENSFNFYGLTLITRKGAIVIPAGYLFEEDAIKQGRYYLDKGFFDTDGTWWRVYEYNISWCVMFV